MFICQFQVESFYVYNEITATLMFKFKINAS